MRRLIDRRPAPYLTAALVAALCATDSELRAQAATNPRFDALVSLTEAKMKEYGVPGVAIGIIDGNTVTARGLGITNVEDSLPVTVHTVFPIASISKTFAATAMMRLVEQGKVDLRAPVRTYIPGFRVRDSTVSRDVTVWHLLTHLGGWEGQVGGPERGTATLENFVATTLPDLMQVAPPGKAWSYNNAGFSIAGRVIEVVTGKSINVAMRELVFQPLGLEHAGTTAGDFIVNRFAAGHSTRDGKTTLQRPFTPSSSVTTGGIGLDITDILAYARFHLGDGTAANGERVLERKSLDLMRTVQSPKQSTSDSIGLAWHIRQVGPVHTYGHGGTLGGHILLLELVPGRNFAISILTNANTGWRLIQDVEREALRSYLGATFAPSQAIAHRGLVETLPSVQPLARQPDPAPYVGTYARPSNSYVVRAEGGKLIVQDRQNSGTATPREFPVAFYGPDRVVVTDGPDRGQSMEFVRDDSGRVTWIRVVGRVAVRMPAPVADHHQHVFSPTIAAILAAGSGTPQVITAREVATLLDSASIQRAALLSVAYMYGSPSRTVEDEYAKVRAENDWTGAQAAGFPERFRALCSFNPLEEYALDELARCAKEPNLRHGIKLHVGNSDVQLDDSVHLEQMRRVFRAANERRMAIVVHLRASISRQRPYGAPQARVFLEQLLPLAPDVPVQIAHLAGTGPGYNDPPSDSAMAVLAEAVERRDPRARNLWFDVATSADANISPANAALIAKRIRQVGVDRILYGSDAALGGNLRPRESWAAFRRVPLTEKEFERIASNVAPYLR